MSKESIEEYLILLNHIKNNNYAIRLKEKNNIQKKKIKEYADKCNELIKKQTADFNDILNNKDQRIRELENEIKRLKESN